MGIVIITIPGEDKKIFANSLHKITGGQVDLVVIQKPRPNHASLIERLKRLYKSVGFWALPREIFYAILLRADESLKTALGYFRERSVQISESGYLPKILETVSINRDDVYKILKELSPDLMVIWGSAIVRPHIFATIKANLSKSPRDLFCELNDEAERQYLDIAKRLFFGESLSSQPQDISLGENFLLKHWTPQTRYKLARQILKWERTGTL